MSKMRKLRKMEAADAVLRRPELVELCVAYQFGVSMGVGTFSKLPEWTDAWPNGELRDPECINADNLALRPFMSKFPTWYQEFGNDGVVRLFEHYPEKRAHFLCGLLALEEKNRATLPALVGTDIFDSIPEGEVMRLVGHVIKRGDLKTMVRIGSLGFSELGCGLVDQAVAYGDARMVAWLYEVAPQHFRKSTMDTAAKHGRLDTVKWLHEHKVQGCTKRAMDRAAMCGQLDICKWLQANRSEGCSPYAFHTDSPIVLKWLLQHYPGVCTEFSLGYAAKSGHLECLKILINHFPNCNREPIIQKAAKNGQSAVVAFLTKDL